MCKEVYPILISKNIIEPCKVQAKWEKILDKEIDFWEDIYLLPRKISFDTNLKNSYKKQTVTSMQFLQLQNWLELTIPHLFWFCDKTNVFLGKYFNWLQISLKQNMKINI